MSLIANKKARILLGCAVAVCVTAAAIAYWTGSGSGSGTATTGTTSPIAVNQTSAVTGLVPGGPAQTLSGTFNNPNTGAVQVHSVHASVSGTDQAGCTATDYAIGGSATVDAEVPAGTGKGAWTGLTISMVDKVTNQDACKGAHVTIAYTSD